MAEDRALQIARGVMERYQRTKDFELGLPILNRIRAALTTRQYILGIDPNRFTISHINDAKAIVNAGYQFAIIEAAWGTWEPATFSEVWPILLDAGMILIAYQFFRGDQKGSDQADFVLNTVTPMYEAQQIWFPIFSDVEPFSGDPSSISGRQTNWLAWTDGIREQIDPGVYCSQKYWKEMMNNLQIAEDVIGWAAHWTSSTEPLLPTGWTYDQTLFHQIGIATKYSWTPAIPGVTGTMDIDRGYMTFDQLMALGKPIGTPPEPPIPGGCQCKEEIARLEAEIGALKVVDTEQTALIDGLKTSNVNLIASVAELQQQLDDHVHSAPDETLVREYVVTDPEKTLACRINGYNTSQYPIIKEQFYEPRIRWNSGDTLVASVETLRADGASYWYKLLPGPNGKNTVPAIPSLYVNAADVSPT